MSSSLPILRLHPARHKRVAGGHPWVYSNEIVMDAKAKLLEPGSLVLFQAHDGSSLGVGSFNPKTLIAGRVLSRAPLEEINQAFFEKKLQEAALLRARFLKDPYYRLIHAEADGLPGLIIDRFADSFSIQVNTAGMQKLWPMIEAALVKLFKPALIVLHNDSSVRTMEGLDRSVEVVLGKASGPQKVLENGITYFADIAAGQKTGWYFDQRDNHALVAGFAKDATVLDLYCHAGGFGLLAAKKGAASVIGVDSSAPALELAEKAAVLNGVDRQCRWEKADVFEDLEKRSKAGEKFDIVIADPPPFVKSRKDVASGARGYRKLTRLAAQVTARGGFLFIASCSHNMELSLFTEEVAKGLAEAKRAGRILHTVFASPDHPVHPSLPESAYLKGLWIALD